jgi:hypothetical protein
LNQILPNQFASFSNRNDINNFFVDGDVRLLAKVPVTVSDCTIIGTLSLSSDRAPSLTFNKCTIKGLHLLSPFNSIKIIDCNIEKLEISQGANLSNLSISGTGLESFEEIKMECSISDMRIEKVKINVLKLSCQQVDHAEVINCNITELLVDSGNYSTFVISEVHQCDKMKIESAALSYVKFNRLTLTRASITELIIKRCVLNLNIIGGSYHEVLISPLESEKIMIDHSATVSENEVVDKPHLNRLVIEPWTGIKGTEIQLTNLEVNFLIANKINFFNNAQFSNVQVKAVFDVTDSTFIKCVFNRITFNPNTLLYLNRAYLQGNNFVNITWPQNHKLEESNKMVEGYDDAVSHLISLRESYRQLKKISFEQNNKIDALEFQKNEMRMHYKIVDQEKFSGLKQFGNFLIVGTHNWFSDFGQNIWKPILLLFGVHFILFQIFMNCKLNIVWSDAPNLADSMEAIHLYFSTLLPTHGTEQELSSGEKVKIPGALDFAMRIFSGYFMFYFVYVSRKYHQ